MSGSQIIAEEWGSSLCIYLYDADGSPIGMQYRTTSYAEGIFDTFWFEKNLQGDIVAVYNASGVKVRSYTYDAWGNMAIIRHSSSGTNGYAQYNPFGYRGYYRDSETGFYYLQSRYYDPGTGRFINSDGQLNGGLLGYNLFAYCGNNPVNMIDPTGEAWWHWALGAAIVAACAVAVVVTAGGAVAGVTAVAMVANGTAAATTASTIAAGAFIGSALTLGSTAIMSVLESDSIKEFNDKGNWCTVLCTAIGAAIGGWNGYAMSKAQTQEVATAENPQSNGSHISGVSSPDKIENPGGSYTQLDNNGNLRSYAQYDNWGRQSMRIDFQGRAHAGVLPHIHLFVYPERGGKVEYIFDLNWHLIN